ncbi:MAG: hypothetical protein ACREHF_11690 [Rhizomicrobium sp.]
MNGDDRLDRLLRTPLATIEDGGFSSRVMARIPLRERQSWLETGALAFTGVALLAVLSATGFFEWMGNFGDRVATSLPLAIAGFALALTLSYARVTAD